ncbi:interferon-induced protein 44-like isoform X2 [Siniperca chuatsi]|uniref:interferon-induced protein 44-like isoform X2 n=1 Tax=Siniperca chuatsi TaxID=119488 RepID=UPI001CE02DAA|nr:interferon-induced protein 44-like isoform X2 [Siniperca chuatsi]XP_044024159.1 interferon-induced protein 44-like isoform X2 [Siniperca chuatsi]
MGRSQSKPAATLLDTPWRVINWRDKERELKYVNNYKPQTKDQQLRILLHGPVGAGKSSFINSVKSVLQNKMCRQALVDNTAHECCTKKYKTYRIQKGGLNTFYPFVFNDMMGLKNSTYRQRKIHVKDVKRAIKGHVKDDYTFNPECKLSKSDQYYNKSPTADDKVHILVCVIDANTVSLMSKECRDALRDIRCEASELGVPQVAILTKIDEVCPEIKQDVKNVYRSIVLQQRMEAFSAEVGIPLNCIFPVKNYHEEIHLNDDADSLILSTLRSIVDSGEDFLNSAA